MPNANLQRRRDRQPNIESSPPAFPVFHQNGWSTFGSKVVLSVLIVLSVFAAYANSLRGQFLFDDFPSIVNNHSIRSLWPLTQSSWGPQNTPTAGRPIANLSFALTYSQFQLNVFGYHLTSIVIHALNAVLLFAILHRTLSRSLVNSHWSKIASYVGFVVALLWAIHPLQTESVSYMTQRTELLMAFFFLLTLYAARLAWDAESPYSNVFWQFISILSCALGMASKEVMVAAPIIVVLYDMTVLKQSTAYLWKKRIVLYLGLASTWLLLAYLLSTNPRGNSVGMNLSYSPVDYFTTQLWAITNYLWLTIWPANLCGDYGIFSIKEPETWFPCLVLLLFLAGMTVWSWLKCRRISFLGICFFLILAPTSSFIPIVSEPVAERRMYLPLAAMVALVVFGTVEGAKRCLGRFESRLISVPKMIELVLLLAGSMLAIVYGRVTYERNRVFKNEIAFWTDVSQKRPLNGRAFSSLGAADFDEKKFDLAWKNFQRAIEIDPSDADPYYNLGKLHTELGNTLMALSSYEQAIALNPLIAEPYCNRALLLVGQERKEEAIQSYLSAIKVDPALSVAHLGLGNIFFSQERFVEAIEQFRETLRLDPRSSNAYANLGALYAHQGEYDEANKWLTQAIKITPKHSGALFNLGLSYAAIGKNERAIDFYTQCVTSQPNDSEAWLRLGKLYFNQGESEQARRCYQQALHAKPDLDDAQKALEELGAR